MPGAPNGLNHAARPALAHPQAAAARPKHSPAPPPLPARNPAQAQLDARQRPTDPRRLAAAQPAAPRHPAQPAALQPKNLPGQKADGAAKPPDGKPSPPRAPHVPAGNHPRAGQQAALAKPGQGARGAVQPKPAAPGPRTGSVVQRQIPSGTHVQVSGPGGTWFGQIEATLPGRTYQVRVGGTDRIVQVPESQVTLHPTVAAMIENRLKSGEALTSRQWNIVRHTPGMEGLAEKVGASRRGSAEVIGQAAYMTGDMIGILSALTLNPDLEVDILVDDSYYVKAYEKDAAQMRLDLITFYLLKHPRDRAALDMVDGKPEKEIWIRNKLSNRMADQYKMMLLTYTRAGVAPSRIHLKIVADAQKAYKIYEQRFNQDRVLNRERPAYHATAEVAKAYGKDFRLARKVLAGAMFFNLNPKVGAEIEEFCLRRFSKGQKLLLVWGRRSGQNPGGAHPELDTNKYVVTQILDLLQTREPTRQIVIIGDPIFKRLSGSKKPSHRGFIDLLDFWDKIVEGHRLDRLEQLYCLHCLNQRCDVIALGMRSGVLEGPALLGMRTLFIEDLACHPQFEGNVGDRMEMWSGGVEGSPDLPRYRQLPTTVPNYRRVQTVARLGAITEMLSNLQLLKLFWDTHQPGEGKLNSADFNVRELVKRLGALAEQAKLILHPGRKRVRFIDPTTLTTLSNRAMDEEIGLTPKEPSEKTPRPLPALNDIITTAAKSLRTTLVSYHKVNASNMSLEERAHVYQALKAALRFLALLTPQDLKLVMMSLDRLARYA